MPVREEKKGVVQAADSASACGSAGPGAEGADRVRPAHREEGDPDRWGPPIGDRDKNKKEKRLAGRIGSEKREKKRGRKWAAGKNREKGKGVGRR